MEGLQKVSMKDFFAQVKNMVLSPKDALKSMGNDELYQSIAVPQVFVSMALVPIAMLLAMAFGMNQYQSFKGVFKMWLLVGGAVMFYYILISWGVSKLLWLLKDSMGFEGSQQKFNKIIALMFTGFFIGNALYTFLTFIDALKGISTYLAPLVGAAAAGYVLFMGFSSDFEASEDKKPIFVGIMVAVPTVAFILFHVIIS
jgi:hypothetical protein